MQSKLNLQEKIMLKDQMMCLKDIGMNEVQSLVMKVSKKIRHCRESVIERTIKYIMKIKVEDVLKDIEEAKLKSTYDQDSLDKIVRPTTVGALEYRRYLKNVLEKNWNTKKGKMKEQAVHLKGKHMKKVKENQDEKVPEEYKGVKISDRLLGKNEVPKKVKIHEGVTLSKEEEEAVDVLPKDTFYSNITMKDGEVQTESCLPK